jgi:hypothetical protein
VSWRKCQKVYKKLTEEEKMRDNPHPLQELNGIIWWEIADTAWHELCHALKNIFSSCGAYLVTAVKRFGTRLWNKVSRTAGHYELWAEAGLVCSKAVRQLLCWDQGLNVHPVSVEALTLWGGISYVDGCKPSLMAIELVKEFLSVLRLCQLGLTFWSDKSGCRCANLIWSELFFTEHCF